MAFSLLDYLQQNKQIQLSLILSDLQQPEQQQALLVFTLGSIVKTDQQQPQDTYQAIGLLNYDFFWQTLNQPAVLSSISQHYAITEEGTLTAINKLFSLTCSELKQLDDAANLEQSGVSELIQGQVEHLQGNAPDWLCDLIPFDVLKQAPIEEDTIDLDQSISELSGMIYAAKNANDPTNEPTATPQKSTRSPALLITIILVIILMAVAAVYYLP